MQCKLGYTDMKEQLLKVRVRKRDLQGDGVVVIELAAADEAALPPFEAGAHVDAHLETGLVRQYSLCGDPAESRSYRLGVLKDPASRGGSVKVHERWKEGTEVIIGAPRNLFPLAHGAQRTILMGGGIGITPMIAMAYSLHARGEPFELHYCGRARSRCAFVDELESAAFADQVFTHFDDEVDSALDIDAVLGVGSPGLHLYTCGPSGFMQWVIDAASRLGYAESNVHFEYFQVEVDGSGTSFEVVAAASGKTVRVEEGQTIVEALGSIGIKIDVSCEQGVCGTCMCGVLEGEPDHRDVYFTDEEKQANDQILLCCSRARSKKLVLDI